MATDDELWQRLAVPPGVPQQPDARPADDNELWRRLTAPPPAPTAATPDANAAPVGRMGSFLYGLGDMPRGAAQLLNRISPAGSVMDQLTAGSDEAVRQREQQYNAGRAAAGRDGTDWWRVGGNVAAGLPLAAAAAPVGLPAAVGVGALTGAAQGAMQPVTEGRPEDFWGQKADQAVTGAVGGAVGAGAGNAIGRLLSPRVSPEVRTLANEGVRMTPGQIIGGTARTIEDKAMSFPILGDAIRAGRAQSTEDLNRAAANRVLGRFGEQVDRNAPIGRDMIAGLQQRVDDAYNAARAQITTPLRPDAQFQSDITNGLMRLDTPAQRQAFQDAFQNHLMPMLRGGEITADVYKRIDSSLGQMGRSLSGSPDAVQQHMAPAYRALQEAVRGLLDRQAPEAAALMRTADQAAGDLMVLERAAAMQGAVADGVPGAFSAPQLSAAVKAGDSTVRDNAYAAGRARMQDLADAGRSVLPAQIPNSGTTDRAALAMLLSDFLNGGGRMAPAVGLTVGALPYTRAGQALSQGLLAGPRTGPIGTPIGLLGDVLAPSGGAVAVPLGGMLLGPPERRPEQRR